MDYTPHLTKRIGLFLLVLAAAIMMLTGCGGGGSSSGGGKETSAKPTSQLEKISSYVKATNGFNGHNVRFAFAIDKVLAKMKAGEDLDFASFPAYDSLKENLTEAQKESSGFSDIDESTTAVLKVLDEMVPLTSKMESYYKSKEYTTDGHQKGREMVASYLKLYDQFNEEYGKLDSAISRHNSELRDLLIEEMKKDNKVMAATYMEIGRDMRQALEAIDPEDPAKTDKAQIEKLLGQVKENMEKLKPAEDVSGVKSFKSSAERAIGRIRTYLAGGGGNDAFNDMVEAYNDFIRDSNRIDASELDNKKK